MALMRARFVAGVLAAALLAAACQRASVAVAPPPKEAPPERIIVVTLKRFEYGPNLITVKKGVPVVLELTALDRTHGFFLKAFGIDEEAKKGKVTRVRFIPDRVGQFEFHCDEFCGDFHDDMSGTLVVVD
jgi:cytochrome c oxidase subunit 2